MPEGAGWDATEGSFSGAPGGDTFYPAEEAARKTYKEQDGVLHVPRRTAGGGTPLVDLKKGLGQFQVNIIDGDSHQTFKPGETDFEGNPIPKDTPCPTTPSPAPAIPSPGSPPPSPSPLPLSSTPTAGTSTGSASPPTKRRGRQSPPPTEKDSLLLSLMEQVNSLRQQLSSPTSAPSPTPPVSKTEIVQISSEMGDFSFEVLGIEARNEGVLVIVWDPKKPRMIPRGDNPIVVHWQDKLYRCGGGSLSLELRLGDREVLLAVLSLLETQG
jgi:hypothetical protein